MTDMIESVARAIQSLDHGKHTTEEVATAAIAAVFAELEKLAGDVNVLGECRVTLDYQMHTQSDEWQTIQAVLTAAIAKMKELSNV